jgi:hypothetical protein
MRDRERVVRLYGRHLRRHRRDNFVNGAPTISKRQYGFESFAMQQMPLLLP